MKVLVIEDNESFSLMLCAALREAGHEVALFSGLASGRRPRDSSKDRPL